VLHERLATLFDHFGKLGAALGRATDSYNAAVGSFERMVKPAVRKLEELGAADKKAVDEIDPVGVRHWQRLMPVTSQCEETPPGLVVLDLAHVTASNVVQCAARLLPAPGRRSHAVPAAFRKSAPAGYAAAASSGELPSTVADALGIDGRGGGGGRRRGRLTMGLENKSRKRIGEWLRKHLFTPTSKGKCVWMELRLLDFNHVPRLVVRDFPISADSVCVADLVDAIVEAAIRDVDSRLKSGSDAGLRLYQLRLHHVNGGYVPRKTFRVEPDHAEPTQAGESPG
jgi:hypothetical protein